MLASLKEEKAQLEARLETLEEREDTLKAWLAEEQPAQRELEIPAGANGSTPLSGFIRAVLADGKPHQLDEIATLAKAKGGLIREGKMPGRVVHFALVGLSQHGYAKRNTDGAWVGKKP